MDKFGKLINDIMNEAEADGEPVTYEEAKEMALMELGSKEIRRYEQSDEPKKARKKERKVDETKGKILRMIKVLIEGMLLNEGELVEVTMKTETDLDFVYKGNEYTIKLTKHRPKK